LEMDWFWVIEDDDEIGLGSSKFYNGHQIWLSMGDVYAMQQDLAPTALAATVTHHYAFVVICTSARCSCCLRVFCRPNL
jgi:hypothetical protein